MLKTEVFWGSWIIKITYKRYSSGPLQSLVSTCQWHESCLLSMGANFHLVCWAEISAWLPFMMSLKAWLPKYFSNQAQVFILLGKLLRPIVEILVPWPASLHKSQCFFLKVRLEKLQKPKQPLINVGYSRTMLVILEQKYCEVMNLTVLKVIMNRHLNFLSQNLLISIWLLFVFSIWGSLHVCIFNIIVLLLTISHVRASFSDPGKMGSSVRHSASFFIFFFLFCIFVFCLQFILMAIS